jgi:hypothetical protein
LSPNSAKGSTPATVAPGPRPLPFSEILRASLKLYLSKPLTLVLICLGLFVLALGMAAGLDALFDDVRDPLFIVVSLLSRILFTCIASFVVAALTAILAGVVAGTPASSDDVRAVLRASTREIVLAGLLSCALLILLDLLQLTQFLLLAVLGPPFVIHAIALEGLPFRGALRRTRELLAGEWGRVLLSLMAVALVLVLAMFLLGMLVSLPASLLSESALDVVIAGYLTLAPSLTMPFFAAAALVLYQDVVARKEATEAAGSSPD